MDYKSLSEHLAGRLNVPREDVGILIHALADVIETCALDRDTVTIPGFGSFEPRLRSEWVAQHPATGKKMLYPPKQTLAFKPSAMLRKSLRPDSADGQ